MITARSYDARCVWIYSGLGDDSDYPGKIRALAAAIADRASIYCYSAQRFRGLPALIADLLASLWAVFPVLRAPVTPTGPAMSRAEFPPGWSLRPVDRLPARLTTGPPVFSAVGKTLGSASVISP